MNRLRIDHPAPALDVKLLDGNNWHLRQRQPESFSLVVFYRGLHCPACKDYLNDLHARLDDLDDLGVETLALSCDTRERAQQAHQDWGLDGLHLGYGLTLNDARNWGLFISSAIKEEEPESFCEPGLFLVRPDGRLFYVGINSMPFGRPPIDDMVDAIEFVQKKDYPPRGVA